MKSHMEYKEFQIPDEIMSKLEASAEAAQSGDAKLLTLGDAGVLEWLTSLSRDEGWEVIWSTFNFPYLVAQRRVEVEASQKKISAKIDILTHNTHMARIITTIDGIHGTIKIQVDEKKERQILELKWCCFDDENNILGFMASFTSEPVLVTELAAEQFVRMVLAGLVSTLELKPCHLKIINHLGEEMSDVQFLPPTFEGNEGDILHLVARQDSLRKIFNTYEQTGALSSECIEVCQQEDVLEDFLSLVQIKASGLSLALRKTDTKEQQNGQSKCADDWTTSW